MTTRGVYWHDTVYIKVHVHITHTHTHTHIRIWCEEILYNGVHCKKFRELDTVSLNLR